MLNKTYFLSWPHCINFSHEYILKQGDENWQAIFVSEFLKNVPTLLRYRNSTLSFKSKMTIFQTQEEEITLEKIKKWPSFLPLGTNLLETTCVNISSCAVFSFPDHRAIFPDQTPKCQRLS